MGDACQIIPMPRRPVRVLCLFKYWRRECGRVLTFSDAIMISVRSSDLIDQEFRRQISKASGAKMNSGYQFVGYLTENGRRSF